MIPIRRIALALLGAALLASSASASHISGIRITQTGNTGLMVNVDVTGFYTTGSTETTMYLGTYYNQIPAIDWGDGSTTPRYGYGPSTGIPLVATSTVVNGIPARSYRGSFSHTYGAPGSYTISAQTGCCPITTPTYTLVSGTIQLATIATTGPFGPTTFTTSYVQNTLAVNAVAPGFSKAHAPATLAVGVPSTLTFTIDNTASTLDDDALAFVDNLPAGVVVASPANVANTCTGGTLTAAPGTSVVSYAGGLVSAGATCTLSVDVSSGLPGSYNNTTGDLTSSFGNSGTASDTLTVTATPPGFSKAFAPGSVGVGVSSTLTFTLDNTANAADAPQADFTDNLPAGLVVAAPSNASTTCVGGTLTAVADSAVVSYTGGTIPAGSTCTVSVDASADLPGSYVNTSGDLTGTFGNSGTASDTLTVTATAPGFSKSFDPATVGLDAPATLTFTLDNTANAAAATAADFTDTLPTGLVVAATPNVVNGCSGGTLTAMAGSGTIAYTGGTIPASASCLISVDVSTPDPGMYSNVTGDLTSAFGNSGTATATLSSGGAPLFTKSFDPDFVPPNGVATLTFTIDNTATPLVVTGLEFVDNLPVGMVIADPANSLSTCSAGIISATPGDNVVSFAGGEVAASSACEVSVDVTTSGPGEFLNEADPLNSSLGQSPPGTATDTLAVGTILDIPTTTFFGMVFFAGVLGLLALVFVRRQ